MSERTIDGLTRVAAVAGLVMGSIGMVEGGIALYANVIKKDGNSSQIADTLEANLIGDCLNENNLRQSLGANTVTLEECRKEREEWKVIVDKKK